MRFPRCREEDGTVIAARCELCGSEIFTGEECWFINGQVICEDCLGEFARRYFAPHRCRGGEDLWR